MPNGDGGSPAKKIKIVLSGLYYPLAMLSYFRLALERRDDVELFTVGPYFGQWIPWKGGMNLPAKYDRPINLPIPNQTWTNATIFMNQLPWEPDLWLQIDAGFALNIPRGKFPVVTVGTDPHVLDYNQQRKVNDHFFCMQKVYSKPGDIWLPYAYDPVWHRPLEDRGEYDYDFCLIGLLYDHRLKLVDELRRRGYRVYCDTGPVFEEARELYRKSKIGFNWSTLQDTNARVFELMAMRIPAAMNVTPDMDELFGQPYPFSAFNDFGSALHMCEELIGSEDLRIQVVKDQWRTVAPHTWDARAETILKTVGLLA